MSIGPTSGIPYTNRITTKYRESASITMTVKNAARNFPVTISNSLTGDVSKSSRVPIFCSSARSRIVIAGDMNIMKNMAPARNPRIVASENASDTDATKKNPVMARKAADTTYAIGEAKYVFTSLSAIVQMNPIVYAVSSSVVSSKKISSSVSGSGVRFTSPHPLSITLLAIISVARMFGRASTIMEFVPSRSDRAMISARLSLRASTTMLNSRISLMISRGCAPLTVSSMRSVCCNLSERFSGWSSATILPS